MISYGESEIRLYFRFVDILKDINACFIQSISLVRFRLLFKSFFPISIAILCSFAIPEKSHAFDKGWYVVVYGGKFADNRIFELSTLQQLPNWEDSYLAALAVGKELVTFGRYCRFEVEGQIVKHFGQRKYLTHRDQIIRSVGKQDHFEFNGVLIFRWLLFPWDRYLDTSFAIGNGLSYATEKPVLEGHRDWDGKAKEMIWIDSEKLLDYVLLEVTFSLPQMPQWALITRIHHRSGVYGFLGTDEGSNFVCWGFKYQF